MGHFYYDYLAPSLTFIGRLHDSLDNFLIRCDIKPCKTLEDKTSGFILELNTLGYTDLFVCFFFLTKIGQNVPELSVGWSVSFLIFQTLPFLGLLMSRKIGQLILYSSYSIYISSLTKRNIEEASCTFWSHHLLIIDMMQLACFIVCENTNVGNWV